MFQNTDHQYKSIQIQLSEFFNQDRGREEKRVAYPLNRTVFILGSRHVISAGSNYLYNCQNWHFNIKLKLRILILNRRELLSFLRLVILTWKIIVDAKKSGKPVYRTGNGHDPSHVTFGMQLIISLWWLFTNESYLWVINYDFDFMLGHFKFSW